MFSVLQNISKLRKTTPKISYVWQRSIARTHNKGAIAALFEGQSLLAHRTREAGWEKEVHVWAPPTPSSPFACLVLTFMLDAKVEKLTGLNPTLTLHIP